VRILKFSEYLGKVKNGENVLIEHSSMAPYPLLFHIIGKEKRWERILVVDVLDSAMPILRWLRKAGINVPTEKIDRIKAGGTSRWGDEIIEVDPHKDPEIFMTRLLIKLKEYYRTHENVATFVVNPERVAVLHDESPRIIEYLANTYASFLGTPSRTVFYFVNFQLANSRYLALLEEASTRVLRIEEGGKFTVLKSIDLEEEGTYLELG
jgi:hypothetical protein